MRNQNELRHDKTNKMSVCPAKTQISLGFRPVWSESSLSAWRNIGSLATHWAHSKVSDQTGWMPRLIWVFAGRTLILLVLSCHGSNHFRFLSQPSGPASKLASCPFTWNTVFSHRHFPLLLLPHLLPQCPFLPLLLGSRLHFPHPHPHPLLHLNCLQPGLSSSWDLCLSRSPEIYSEMI